MLFLRIDVEVEQPRRQPSLTYGCHIDCARGSTAQIRAALAARSAAIVKSPNGPAPVAATVSPG
jgi:hypothetical protein